MHIHQQPIAEKVISLLERSGLPTDDLKDNSFENFFYFGPKDNPVGVVGLELFEGFGLLRSLAVAEKSRGKGVGKSLLETAERFAQSQGLENLYIITDTASHFFARMGYIEVARDDVPDSLRNTPEFTHLCSDSAMVMKKDIQVGHFISIYP